MKMAEVIPLNKGKAFDEVVNYRPVSLLLTILNVLEKAVYVRLYRFLVKENTLYDSQHSFWNNRSCEQAISEVIGRILQGVVVVIVIVLVSIVDKLTCKL